MSMQMNGLLLHKMCAEDYGPEAKAQDVAEFLFICYRDDIGLFLDFFGGFCDQRITALFGRTISPIVRTEAIRDFFIRRELYQAQRAVRKGARSPEAK